MNAEFQRIARRDKKSFLSDQCKEIEGKNRMGKTRDLFKKIRDTKGTFHAKMGTIKDRNGVDLTEAEDIKKRWQEYIEKLHTKMPGASVRNSTHGKVMRKEASAYAKAGSSLRKTPVPEHLPPKLYFTALCCHLHL